jgi:hypothetical protein
MLHIFPVEVNRSNDSDKRQWERDFDPSLQGEARIALASSLVGYTREAVAVLILEFDHVRTEEGL